MRRRRFLIRAGQAAFAAPFTLSPRLLRYKSANDRLLSDVERLLPRLLNDHKIPGLSAAIIIDGQLLWNKPFGVKSNDSKDPVNTQTVFEAASVSKTVFAYAVMKLCETGTLSLDAPLYRYLPKPFLEGDPRVELITARHALSHQSGFQNMRSSDEPLKIHFTPGKGFMYSGEGYFYLQSVVTQLTGKINTAQCGSYEADLNVCATDIGDYIVRNMLIPHGMTSSGYVWNDMLAGNVALPHGTDGKVLTKSHPTETDMARYASAGGLSTNAGDFSKFLIGLFHPADNDPHRLNSKSQNEMLRPQIKLPNDQKIDGATSWGLGWAIQERAGGNVFLHSGGQSGYKSLMMVSLQKRSGFVMFTNSDNGGYLLYDKELTTVLDQLFT